MIKQIWNLNLTHRKKLASKKNARAKVQRCKGEEYSYCSFELAYSQFRIRNFAFLQDFEMRFSPPIYRTTERFGGERNCYACLLEKGVAGFV